MLQDDAQSVDIRTVNAPDTDIPSFTSMDFRKAMGCFATGVAVATTRAGDGQPVGITINSLASVSLDPPLILFCLDRKVQSFGVFSAARSFAVNILSEEQKSLSVRFAQAGGDKWSGVSFVEGESDCPILDGCLANMECDIHATYDGGDHVIFVGRVRRLWASSEGQPLGYFRGRYVGVQA